MNKKDALEKIRAIYPERNETKILQEGKFKILCKIFGHKKTYHHAFHTEKTARGVEYYEVYACFRCSIIKAKLVNIIS